MTAVLIGTGNYVFKRLGEQTGSKYRCTGCDVVFEVPGILSKLEGGDIEKHKTNLRMKRSRKCRCAELQNAAKSCEGAFQAAGELHTTARIAELEARLAESEARNQLLEARLDELRRNMPTAVSNTVNNQTINIVIPFNITPLPCKASVLRLFSNINTDLQAAETIPKYIRLKHFAADETRNIKLTNVRGSTVQLIETEKGGDDGERKWCHRDRKSVVASLTDSNMEELKEVFGADKCSAWLDWYEKNGLGSSRFHKQPGFIELVKLVDRMLMSEGRKSNFLRV